MSVGRICSREVHTAGADESIVAAARRMRERNVGTLVVVDERGRPAGLLSDRDLAMRVLGEERDPGRTRVAEVMTSMPTTVLESSSIESALGRMRTGPFRRLPVVDGAGALVGLVTLDDVVALVAEELAVIGALLERERPHPAA